MPSSPAIQQPNDAMSAKQPGQLLYDSEATLRLVDSAMLEFGESGEARQSKDAADDIASASMSAMAGLSQRFERGYNELIVVLDNLRRSRSLLDRWVSNRGGEDHVGARRESSTTEVGSSGFASAVLLDLEQRLVAIARVLDPAMPDAARQCAGPHGLPTTFDPDAGAHEGRKPVDELVATHVRAG